MPTDLDAALAQHRPLTYWVTVDVRYVLTRLVNPDPEGDPTDDTYVDYALHPDHPSTEGVVNADLMDGGGDHLTLTLYGFGGEVWSTDLYTLPQHIEIDPCEDMDGSGHECVDLDPYVCTLADMLVDWGVGRWSAMDYNYVEVGPVSNPDGYRRGDPESASWTVWVDDADSRRLERALERALAVDAARRARRRA